MSSFFSREGYQLGSKASRVQEIADITRISNKALEGKAMSHFSVKERMSWTERRKTTRDEDMAYSLLGIFDIQMSLFYGEGMEKAFKRLDREIANSQEGGEVHKVALRADYFEFVSQAPTMLHETNSHFSLLMGNSNKDRRPDLIAVKRTGTRDENIEVNVLYGSSSYQKFVLRIATPDFTPLRKKLD